MVNHKEKRLERKKTEEAFLEKFNKTAPKGPGFTWKVHFIFAVIFLLFVLAFAYGKQVYLGSSPMKLIDYSLTQSFTLDARDVNLTFNAVEAKIIYSFDDLKAIIQTRHADNKERTFYITPHAVAYKAGHNQWHRYVFNDSDRHDASIESVLNLNALPHVDDIFSETIQFFISEFYNRFTYGDKKLITTDTDTYICKQINLKIRRGEFYDLLQDFLYFSSDHIKIRTALKDWLENFILAVDKNDLYQSFNLEKEDIKLLMTDFDFYYDIFYYNFEDHLTDKINESFQTIDGLNSEFYISFYIDKNFNVRAIDLESTDDIGLDDFKVTYVVNHFNLTSIASPLTGEMVDLNVTDPPFNQAFKKVLEPFVNKSKP